MKAKDVLGSKPVGQLLSDQIQDNLRALKKFEQSKSISTRINLAEDPKAVREALFLLGSLSFNDKSLVDTLLLDLEFNH
jgi:hypothetical protein